MGTKFREYPEPAHERLGLCPKPTTLEIATNNAVIGQVLGMMQSYFPLEKGWELKPFDIDAELSWLQEGLRPGYSADSTVTVRESEIHLRDNMLRLVQIDRDEYNPHAIDSKKRQIMERIHRIQEYFARGLIKVMQIS